MDRFWKWFKGHFHCSRGPRESNGPVFIALARPRASNGPVWKWFKGHFRLREKKDMRPKMFRLPPLKRSGQRQRMAYLPMIPETMDGNKIHDNLQHSLVFPPHFSNDRKIQAKQFLLILVNEQSLTPMVRRSIDYVRNLT